MELQISSLTWYHSISHQMFSNILVILPFIPLLILLQLFFILTILIIKRRYFHCKCEICHSYVTLSWSQIFPNLGDWYTNLLHNSPTKTIHIHVLDNIITANPKNVEHILKTNFENYPKGKPFSSILGDLLGHGIFNVDGDAWRFQKRMASLELGRQSVRSFSYYVVKTEIDHLVPHLCKQAEKGQVVDLQEIFKGFAFTTICDFSFGLEIRQLEGVASLDEFLASFDIASSLSAQRALEVSSLAWKAKRLLSVGAEKKLKEAIKKVDDLAMAVIKLKREMGLARRGRHMDLLSRFMGTTGSDDKYLRDIVLSFLLAGRDTVASALTSFFWLVATHPRIQIAILAEADRVLGEGKELSKFEQIREFQYLQATIYESMRLFPPVQFDSKFAKNDDVLPDGTKVRKGDRVTYHPYAMGRMEEIWGKKCLEFKPERWLNKQDMFCQENPYKYPVFQAGVRVCLGKEMTLVEMKCVILALLREFRVELANQTCDQVPRFSPGLTATFKGGLPVILHRRTTKKIS